MVKLSKARVDLENARLEQAIVKRYHETISTVAAAASTTLDIANGNVFNLTQDTNITTLTISNPASSGTATSITIIRTKDESALQRTIIWPASFKWSGGSAPMLDQTPGGVNVITAFTKDAGSTWYAFAPSASASAGGMWAWGLGTSGQLGQVTTVAVFSSPVQIGTLVRWVTGAGGSDHSLGLRNDSTLWGWGLDTNGPLGQVTTVASRSSPVQIGTLANWSSPSAGFAHSLATKTDGTLWAWGLGSSGQLGQVTTVAVFSSPVQIGTLTGWSTVAAGSDYSLGLKTSGTLWGWGLNTSGQIGDNTATLRSSPVQVGTLSTWSVMSTGNAHSLSIKTDGTLWAWGGGTNGQLGEVSSAVARSSPIQVGTLATWTSVGGGFAHSLATKTDGTLWAWGLGSSGQLGQVTTVAVFSSPVQIGTLTGWSTVAAGSDHSLATKTNGTLWAWGNATQGQIGDNTATLRSSPVQIGTLATWSGVISGLSHSMAFRS